MLQDEEEKGAAAASSSVPSTEKPAMTDEEFARMLQQQEEEEDEKSKEQDSKKKSKKLFGGGNKKEESTDEWGSGDPPPSDFSGPLQMRKELKGLGWRAVYGRVVGSTLAVYADEKRGKAELKVELVGATLSESESAGKVLSKKDEIYRFKIVPNSETVSGADIEAKLAARETEFATNDEDKRSEWLGRCVVAGAKPPGNPDFAAKIYKPLLVGTGATPERAAALRTLATALTADETGSLARSLASAGVLKSVAECLRSGPGQESAARCVFFASRGDRTKVAAKALAEASAAELLLPLLTASDDALQRWSAAAMAPAVSFGDTGKAAKKGAKGVVDGGGIFTLVALLSATSRDVQTYALAALVAVCEIGLAGDDESLARSVVQCAVDAGCFRSLAPLIDDAEPRVAGAALDILGALSCSNSAGATDALRREVASFPRLASALVKAASSSPPQYKAVALRALADACYSVDEWTGIERRENAEAVSRAAKALQARGATRLASEALRTSPAENEYSGKSTLVALAERLSAARRGGSGGAQQERREDASRLLAALMAHAPGAADEAIFPQNAPGGFDGGLVAALVGCVATDLAASITEKSSLRCTASLPALTLAVATGSRRRDARPAVAAAQSGLLELFATRGFFEPHLVVGGSGGNVLLVARSAALVNALVDASWRDDDPRHDSSITLALAAPPGGRVFGRLAALLDACAADLDQPNIARVAINAALALGGLCGAARPVGFSPHPSEAICRRDLAPSTGVLLLLGRYLAGGTGEAPAARHAAARLLAALVRDDEADARACARAGNPVDYSPSSQLDAAASVLARAGLVGVAAANLACDDPYVRADCLDAFAALAPFGGEDDRDTAAGAAALGDALARGLVADDAAARHAASGDSLVPERAKVAVEKAVAALEAACQRGGSRTRDAVALDSPAPGALANLTRAVAKDDDFSLRVASSSLGALAALATDSEVRAAAVASSGVLSACRSLLEDASPLADNALVLLELLAPKAPQAFLADKSLLVGLTRALIQPDEEDDAAMRRRAAALAALAALAASEDPAACNSLAHAARKVKPAVPALTAAVNGEWGRPYVAPARSLLDAVAVSSISNGETGDVDDDHESDTAGDVAGDSSDAVDDGVLRLFEDSVCAKLSSGEGIPKDHLAKIRRGASALGSADPKALATLIATPRDDENAGAAVDRACGALASLIANDSTGQTAAIAIQAGALGQLLKFAPSSVHASACLVALLDVGEIHKPLLVASPTPPVAAKYIDCLADMLAAGTSASFDSSSSRGDELIEISSRAVAYLATVCRDSDAAVLALRVAIASRGRLYATVARLAAVASAEHRSTTDRSTDDITCNGAFVLSCLVAPTPSDALDNFDDLCREDDESNDSAPLDEAMLSLAAALSENVEPLPSETTSVGPGGVVVLLESRVAGPALSRALPALLGLLERLPPGATRARARRVVARIASASRDASTRLVASGGVDVAVSLVAKYSDGLGDGKHSTAAADAACGLAVLGALVRATKERASRSALAHDELLSALASAVVSSTGGLADSALKVLVELADSGDSARAYVAGREDLMNALVARFSSYRAARVLANVAAGATSERDAVASLRDLKPALFDALSSCESPRLFAAAAALSAPVFESYLAGVVEKVLKNASAASEDGEGEGEDDKIDTVESGTAALAEAIVSLSKTRDVSMIVESGASLVRAISASLSISAAATHEATEALQEIVIASVDAEAPSVAEPALAELCGPLLDAANPELRTDALLAVLSDGLIKKDKTWIVSAQRVPAALLQIVRESLRLGDDRVASLVSNIDFQALSDLAAIENSSAALDATRLLHILGGSGVGAKKFAKNSNKAAAPDAPSTSAAASIAAALGSLSL